MTAKIKPILALTMGDLNGIGPEICLKSALAPAVKHICTPVLIGCMEVFEYYAHRSKLKITLREIESFPVIAGRGVLPVIESSNYGTPTITPGTPSGEAGQYAGESIQLAVALFLRRRVHGIVTAPTSKETMNNAGFRYPGQTEMIAALSGEKKPTMMLIAKNFRVALATVHLPHREVARHLSQDLLIEKLVSIHATLKKDFALRQPKIAVLGLNPHAGEYGLLGSEEIEIILPAIQQARKKQLHVEGPFPADGFFGTHSHNNYDAVLAMYHDQGLIPLKMSGFNIGVNFSAGLPVVRTSPDHGTAFPIAGKGVANPSSMIEAIKLAVNIIHHRTTRR